MKVEIVELLSCVETRLTLLCLRLCLQDQPPTAAMEETLTCRRSPFSQVFGRQGQLMQASECRSQRFSAGKLNFNLFFSSPGVKFSLFAMDVLPAVLPVVLLLLLCLCFVLQSVVANATPDI